RLIVAGVIALGVGAGGGDESGAEKTARFEMALPPGFGKSGADAALQISGVQNEEVIGHTRPLLSRPGRDTRLQRSHAKAQRPKEDKKRRKARRTIPSTNPILSRFFPLVFVAPLRLCVRSLSYCFGFGFSAPCFSRSSSAFSASICALVSARA